MKKKLFYVVEKEISSDGESLDGLKNVRVYKVANNSLTLFFSLELDLSDNSEREIQDYLDDNGYGDDDFEFVQL